MENELDINVEVSKALTTQPASTGDILIPPAFEQGIRDHVDRESPIYALFNKKSWNTNAVTIKIQTALPGAASYAEMAALMDADHSTWEEKVFATKNIHSRIEISGQEIAATASFVDVLELEARNAADAITMKLEALTISGNSATTSTDFDGLLKQITNLVKKDSSGDGLGTDTLLTLDMLDEAKDATVLSTPNGMIMTRAMYRRVKSLTLAMVRYVLNEDIEVNAGVRVPTWDGIPIAMPRIAHSGLNNKVIFVNRDKARFYVLKPVTLEPLAKGKDSVDFFLKTYLTFVVEGPGLHHTVLQGVKAA